MHDGGHKTSLVPRPFLIGYYRIFSVYRPYIELYVMQNPRTITMVMRLVAMETPAYTRAMCTRPFLLLLSKGLGTRLAQDYRVNMQWCTRTGIPYNQNQSLIQLALPHNHVCVAPSLGPVFSSTDELDVDFLVNDCLCLWLNQPQAHKTAAVPIINNYYCGA